MSVLRGTVFPVVRLILWAVIAASLAWLAFGRADRPPDSVATPSFEVSAPEVEVTTGTVENVVTLPGTVSADPAAPVKATAAGQVSRLRVQVGDTVGKGTPLLDVVSEAPAASAPAPGAPPPAPTRTTTVVRATAAGTVTTLDVLRDQQVSVGDTAATVSPGTLTVTASLTQEQQFRLLTPPTVADVTVPGGPAPFRCTDVGVGQPTSTPTVPGPQDPYAPPSGPATGSLTCRVPADATVFAGMSATVKLQAGVATNVLVLPVTAVQGSVATGTVWILSPDGGRAERTVTLGLTDGMQVEIRTGLTAGDRVLQFVPNSDVPAGGEFGPGGPPGVVYGSPGG